MAAAARAQVWAELDGSSWDLVIIGGGVGGGGGVRGAGRLGPRGRLPGWGFYTTSGPTQRSPYEVAAYGL
ncbi:MAG: hypothetical protein CW349_05705 [Firmicutes bacterium]|nr:hypothetical protein [Bacillota bacterium]